jgi:hypothetical protein
MSQVVKPTWLSYRIDDDIHISFILRNDDGWWWHSQRAGWQPQAKDSTSRVFLYVFLNGIDVAFIIDQQ